MSYIDYSQCTDLKNLVREYSGSTFSNDEFNIALRPAIEKLNRIITTYGDEDGERRKSYYLAQLISEQIIASRFTDYYIVNSMLINMEKECAAKANAPSK